MIFACVGFIVVQFLFLFDLYEPQPFDAFQSSFQSNVNKIDDLDTIESVVLSQSTTCTQSDDVEKIQCFREIPLPKYEVFEGEDVLMRCRVAFQKGKLQWAFKGKMLGFDRDIPNYPRMRMPGNYEIGDHSIFIENAKVTDSGNYECQLSPSSSQPPRRRMTKLIVLRAPMPPLIYRDRVLSKHNISVSIKRDKLAFTINLTCVSNGGNPSPAFEWNVNGSRLQSSSIFRSVRTKITMVNESASLLSLRSNQILNNDVISCGVFNSATRKRTKLDERILLSQIRVFKRILPGPLRFKEISSNSITVQEKEQLRLSCMTDDPGDPPIRLTWETTLLNHQVTKDMVTNSEIPMLSQTTIVIPSVVSTWHRESLICRGSQGGMITATPISATILVKHLPAKMNLAATSVLTNRTLINPNRVYLREEQIIKLICTTSPFYSQNLKIVWFVKLTAESEWRKVVESGENVVEMDHGKLQMLNSVLEITPSFFNKNIPKRFRINAVCILRSPDSSGEQRKQIILEAYERPASPIITINEEIKSPELINGQSVKIKCTITGGYPIPEINLVDDRNTEIITRKFYQLSSSTAEYSMEVVEADNGRKFRCITLSNDTIDFVPLSTDLITLMVAIPPKLLTMKVPLSTFTYQAYQVVSFYCQTDSSYPEAKIDWLWHHSCKIQHIKFSRTNRLSSLDIRPFCESELIEDNHISTYDVSTLSTTSTINIKLLPSHDLTFIECQVSPHSKWLTFKSDLSKITQLRVQYLPQLPAKLERIYTVEEGHNMTVGINVTANPTINGYSWLVNRQPITRKSQIELKVDKFSVLKAQPHMMGNYTLILENQLGKTSFSFFLNVTFAPKLLGPSVEILKMNILKEHKQKSSIMCSAQANPFMDQTQVQWFREAPLVSDHSDLVNKMRGQSLFSMSSHVHCAKGHWSEGNVSVNCISLGAIEVVSILQVMPIDHRYIGSYKCVFSNSIKPSSAVKTTHLVFPTMPVPLRNQRKSEYTAKIGGKTQIACYFVSYPTPTIVWIHSPNSKCSEDTRKYATSLSNPQTGLVKAVLAIRETNESDIGTYICYAQNIHGKSSHLVLLEKPKSPTQPINVTLINITETTITLGWIVGFNGGSKQTIELRWRPYQTDSEFSYMELGESEDSDVQFYTINDLQSHKEYEILIQARNHYTTNTENPIHILAKTIKYEYEGESIQSDGRTVINKGNKGKSIQENADRHNILIIILLSTIGGLLVGLKIGLVVYFLRRRNLKRRKSLDKMSSPLSQRIPTGYLTSADSIEMRAPSLIRSGIESNMYAQSISDHMSQSGSDCGPKLNYYKTQADEFQPQYLRPDVDLVASAIGRNHFSVNGVPSNLHPAYVQLAESSSLTGYPDPYFAGYYSHKPMFYNQTPSRVVTMRSPNHSVLEADIPQQHLISQSYQKNYPYIAVSRSTASGDSNRSMSPTRKFTGYSPLIGLSCAPSTVDEYLSSVNSGSEYHRCSIINNQEPYSSPVTSFRLNRTDYSDSPQRQMSEQEPGLEIPSHEMNFDNGVDFHYSMVNDRRRQSTNSDNEQLLKPPIGFSSRNKSKANEIPRHEYVDLISHSSPSVIRINGTLSETL